VLLHLSALAMSGVEKLMTENIINFSDRVNEKSAMCKEWSFYTNKMVKEVTSY
jgi:hypothetical protein